MKLLNFQCCSAAQTAAGLVARLLVVSLSSLIFLMLLLLPTSVDQATTNNHYFLHGVSAAPIHSLAVENPVARTATTAHTQQVPPPPPALPFQGSQFRYDFYLSDELYPEYWAGPPPTNKGRLFVVVKQSDALLTSIEERARTQAAVKEAYDDSDSSSWTISVLFNLSSGSDSSSSASSFEVILDPRTVDPLKESDGLIDWVRAEINQKSTRRAVVSLHTSNVSALIPNLQKISILLRNKVNSSVITWGTISKKPTTTRKRLSDDRNSPEEATSVEGVNRFTSTSSPLTHASPTTPVIITHVASINSFSQLVVHIKAPSVSRLSGGSRGSNTGGGGDGVQVNITGFEINGVIFSPNQNAAAQQTSSSNHSILLSPGDHFVFTTPVFPQPIMGEGFVWTVLMDYYTRPLSSSSSASSWTRAAVQMGNGGRLVKEVFFQEAWQHSNIHCPLPIQGEGSRQEEKENAEQYEQFCGVGGMNTFMQINCRNASGGQSFAEEHGIYWMAAHQDGGADPPSPWIRNRTINVTYPPPSSGSGSKNYSVVTNQVASVFCGDEVDGNPAHNGMKQQLQKVLTARKYFPFNPTYQGAKTSHYVGTYAGITDIQGLDFYVAACAPHITPAITPMNIQGSFDYLWNVRNNQQPLPMWGYTQALEGGWNTNISTPEFIIQIGSAVLAGTKSLMQFMASTSTMYLPQFTAAGNVVRSLSAVGEYLRAGDIGGSRNITVLSHNASTTTTTVAFSSPTWVQENPLPKLMAEMVVGPVADTVLILVANFDAGGYNDLLCEVGLDLHWIWSPHPNVTVIAELPPQMSGFNKKIKTFTEALDGSTEGNPGAAKASLEQGDPSHQGRLNLRLDNVALGTQESVFRIFVVKLENEPLSEKN